MVREPGTLIAIGMAAILLGLSPLLVTALTYRPSPSTEDSVPSITYDVNGGPYGRLLTGGIP